MPTRNFTRVDLGRVYLPLAAVAFEVVARCEARGAGYIATFGSRSLEEQAELYRLYREGKGGKAAPAGLSAHNYGLAFDFCRDGDRSKPGLQPDWRGAAFKELGEESQRAGLVWGGAFADAPHVQWPGYVNATSLASLRVLADREGVAAVWMRLDKERSSPLWRAANPRLAAELARLGF
jgi:peptidoglycan LD-endopeptidase CwlK